MGHFKLARLVNNSVTFLLNLQVLNLSHVANWMGEESFEEEDGFVPNNMLCVPIFNSQRDVIGVAQLINKVRFYLIALFVCNQQHALCTIVSILSKNFQNLAIFYCSRAKFADVVGGRRHLTASRYVPFQLPKRCRLAKLFNYIEYMQNSIPSFFSQKYFYILNTLNASNILPLCSG